MSASVRSIISAIILTSLLPTLMNMQANHDLFATVLPPENNHDTNIQQTGNENTFVQDEGKLVYLGRGNDD